MEHKPVYYSEYLELERILNSQHPVSFQEGNTPAHDEMLFIVIHQAYELWFKQILFEVQSVIDIMEKPEINDNSSELQFVVHRLQRVSTILMLLVQQIEILDTMTPMDFLDFRDMLRPASGFQSIQFKILEAKLGLAFEQRHGKAYYTSQLTPADVEIIKKVESQPSLVQLLNKWLERMPFFDDKEIWKNFAGGSFWDEYKTIYENSLGEGEKLNAKAFQSVIFGDDSGEYRALSPKASRAALFIILYRGHPMLELPFQFLNTLIQIDNQLGNWRSKHVNMVRRMIGTRTGTGGSTGAGYLQGAMDKHYIYRELSQLHSFLIDRRRLPQLPQKLIEKLGYKFC
ncbi:MAG: tryptophan 2,3-dioxygenase [Bacteroidetes bacterium]|nr:tryptophan 2,3-dioxygenase [Bacteroidota bacterium]